MNCLKKILNLKIVQIVFSSLLILIMLLGFLAYLYLAPIYFLVFFKYSFSSNNVLPYLLYFVSIFIILYFLIWIIKNIIFFIIELLNISKRIIKKLRKIINNYLILSVVLIITFLVIGLTAINQIYRYGLPLPKISNEDTSISCGDYLTDMIENQSFKCKIDILKNNKYNFTPAELIFVFEQNDKYIQKNISINNSINEIYVKPEPKTYLSCINIYYENGEKITVTCFDKVQVYSEEESEQRQKERIIWFYAVFSFSFLSVLTGVYYLKKIIEGN